MDTEANVGDKLQPEFFGDDILDLDKAILYLQNASKIAECVKNLR